MTIRYALIFLSLFLVALPCVSVAQRLPFGKNQTDANQKRQGDWVIWMDAKWQPTNDSSSAMYYRRISYKDDKPVGSVSDYYRNGTKQYEGLIIQDRPEDILDGIQTWYYPSGEKRVIEKYINNESQSTIVYLRSGELADENWVANYYRKGERFSDEKKYEAAANEFLKAIQHAEAFFSRESEEYAAVADWLGLAFSLAGRKDKAIPYEEEYIAVRRLIHAQPDTLMLNVLEDLGSAYRLQENYPLAKKRLREFIDLNSKFFKANHPDFPTAIQTLGSVCEKLREYNNALSYLTEARKFFDADPDKYEYPKLSNLFALSGVYLTVGDFAKGEEYLLKEIPRLKKKYGAQSEYYRTALGLLARTHVGAAKYALAESEWKEVLNLIRATEGEQSENYAQFLASLAELNVAKGDIATADKLIHDALKIYEKQTTRGVSYLEFLSKVSVVYGYMGNKQALLETSQKRKEAASKMYGNKSVEYARTLLALVDLAFLNKDWIPCEQLINEALAIYSKIDIKALSEVEKTNLALLKSRLGTIYLLRYFSKPEPLKLAAADEQLKDAISIFDAMPEKIFSSNITDTYLAYAMVFEYKNDIKQADRLYDFVYSNVRKQWGESHPYLINVLFLIAKKSEIRKNYQASFENYKKAIALHQKYTREVFPYLSETEKEQFYENNKDIIGGFQGFAAQYAQQIPGLAEAWCNFVLDQKGIVLHSFNPIRNAIFNLNDQTLKTDFAAWQETKNKYGRLLQDERADSKEVDQLKTHLNELEKSLSSRTNSLNLNFKYVPLKWTDVQKSLKADEAAVEIVSVVCDRPEGADSAYYALIIRSDLKQPDVVRLASLRDAEGKPFKFYRNSIKLLQQDVASYAIYFRELEKHLNGIHTVYCSADGIYHQVNLATLFNPETKKYVADEKLIRAVPSTAWIVQKERKDSRLTQSTFFAHPTYGEATASTKADLTRSLDLDNISDLPGTEIELNELTTLMKENNIKFAAFDGATATEEAIKKIQSPQVLHIATHGFFLPQSQAKDKFENPLLRSGLLLAGCQKKLQVADNSREDGVLTAFEASTLPLYRTSLVVMSACETGLGEVKNGEGVYGLQRAFFMAGAEQLLMSLWKVDDQATQQFMVSFYKEWIGSQNISKAFRQAQQKVKEKYPEPFYWGAFVLNGY